MDELPIYTGDGMVFQCIPVVINNKQLSADAIFL